MNGRRLQIALAVSILLNLFALGAAGGAAVMWARLKPASASGAPPRRPLRAAADALSPAERERFRQVMRAAGQETRPIRRQARLNRREAAELFVQPRFDAAAVNAALAQARSADFALRARLETAAVSFAADLPLPERTALAQGLSRGGPLRNGARLGRDAARHGTDRP